MLASKLKPDQIQAEVEKYKWWHTIDLGDGIITPGRKTAALMAREFENVFSGIDLVGKRVLDVGCWNGAFSVEAARRGAREVIGLERPGNPFSAHDTFRLVADVTGLPLRMAIVDLDEPRLSLDHLGKFDVILYLGVFYHLIDPIAVTRELAAITKEAMIVETYIERNTGERPAMVFFPGAELNRDPSNWWGPNAACIVELLKLNGFTKIDVRDLFGTGNRGTFAAFR